MSNKDAPPSPAPSKPGPDQMSGAHFTDGEPPTWGRVEIRVKGHLEPRWSDWLDGLTLTCEDGGTTLIEGRVVDQSALFGIIQRLRDLALPLISVQHIDAAERRTDHVQVAGDPNNPASFTPRSES